MASSSSVPANTLPPRIDIPMRREESGGSYASFASASSSSCSTPQAQTQAQGPQHVRSPKQPYSLAKSFSERLASLSPRNRSLMAPPSRLALGPPTAAGGNGGGSAPGSVASSPRQQQQQQLKQHDGSGSRSGSATPTKSILQRFHTASPRAGGAASPMSMAAAALRSPSSYRATMGPAWMRAIMDMYQAQLPEQMAASLGEVRALLRTQAQGRKDVLKGCHKDLKAALNEKKRKLPAVFTPEVHALVLAVLQEFFDHDLVNRALPTALLINIAQYLPAKELGTVSATCKAWHETLGSDGVWKPLYIKRFHFLDPREAVGLLPFKRLFRERLLDPHVGDLVEVAWKGKFRLESLDIYQGLAWWSAVVVDKRQDGSRYKIHYPGWDARWDEWVHRDRLRWTVEQDLGLKITANDDVEIWCCGSNVPGAWLEAKVRKVKGGKYCVGQVASSGGPLWVERARVRMSPKGARNLGKRAGGDHGPSFFGREAAAALVGGNCSLM